MTNGGSPGTGSGVGPVEEWRRLTGRNRGLIWILIVMVAIVAGLGVSALRRPQADVRQKPDLARIEEQLGLQLRIPPSTEAEVVSARIDSVLETSSFDRKAAFMAVNWRGRSLVVRQGYPNQAWSVTGREPKVPWTFESAIHRPDEQIHVLSDGSTAVILPRFRDSFASAYWLPSSSLLVEVIVPNSPENSDIETDDIRRFLELMT